MKTTIATCLALSVLLTACAKKDDSASASATNNSSGNPLTAPVDYLGAVAKAQKTAVRQVDLASLKSAINLFNAQEERYPADLNELVTRKYLPALPPPPAGSRFSYDAKTGEIKIVAQ